MAKTPEAKVKDRIHALLAEFHGCAAKYFQRKIYAVAIH
jgi:hypothetical protein